AYTAINPNGRVPAIHDPNTDITLWESGAIVLYLLETYDKSYKLSFPAGTKEAHLARQWLLFQASGQGPYYGQAVWFNKFHPEKLPSAKERYVKEAGRVTGVLEGWLAKQEVAEGGDGPWLVGGRLSYADLAFISWQLVVSNAFKGDGFEEDDYPLVKAWLGRMLAREAVKKAVAPMGY
ncbi:glutathione S-transferase family protein, partial [Candidatus Bathyarchaeota archaeon]|nr:glutathione S-transferase family protein [Candidatus Bathyarchaeota archaeon]